MKFVHCLLSTFFGFVVIYFASLDFGLVNDFDGGPPRLPSKERPEVRSSKVTIVRKPDPKPTFNPSDKQSIQKQIETSPPTPIQPKPVVTDIVETPSPSQSASKRSTPRDGTRGLATINLEVLVVQGVNSDDELQQLLLFEDCKIIAVKVEEKKVVEAFLPDRFNNLVKTSGEHGTGQFESFRRAHPTSQFVWFRWHEVDSGIGNIARAELRRFNVKPDEYFIYLILGRELSTKIQQLLSRKASEERLAFQDIGYAQILLDADRTKFRTKVLQVEPRPSMDNATESDTQAGDVRIERLNESEEVPSM